MASYIPPVPAMTYSDTWSPGAGYYNGQWGIPSSATTGALGTMGIFNDQTNPYTDATNVFHSPQYSQTAAAPTMQDSGGITMSGSDAWLSANELRARHNAAFPAGSSDGSNEDSGGGSSAMGTSNGTSPQSGVSGLNLGNANAATGGTSPGFTNSGYSASPTIGYQNPGGVNNTPMVGYQGLQEGPIQGQQGVLQMQQANPGAALAAYQNTPGYQLLNAPGAYQQSPGYQYAMDQALGQVQNRASARGMLESGSVLRDMQRTASGLAQQDYGNWWNRQNQLYGDYQNRLQGLAGGPTGSADAMTTGANLGQATLQTGSNLGSLFGNQGTTGMGGIINTGAAQSGNMINAAQQQAQVNAANQSTQLAGATLQRGLF